LESPEDIKPAHDSESDAELPTHDGVVVASSQRLRVMQLTWSLVAGGAEVYALTIASNLDADAYETFMCGVDQGGALEPEIRRRGVPYFVMNRRPGIDLTLAWRLYKLFRRTRVDVVQTHHFNQLFYGALAARLAGARLIHTEHSFELYERRLKRVLLRALSMLCERVVAVGDEGARELTRRLRVPARKVEVIRAGVDLPTFEGSRDDARRALGLTQQDRVATVVARLYPEKNHMLLLEAFADVVRRVEGARLLVVGDGIERERLEEEIKRLGLEDCVTLLGVRRDIALILAATDVFVLSSDREGLPLAVLEALAAARPVVATTVGELPTVLSDQKAGHLVPPRDARALADALARLLADPALAARMGEQARLVARPFGVREMILRYEKIFAPK
jgi:glycosyltransferase involved in cell wall biosynthesis